MEIQKIEEARIVALLLTDGGITKTHFDRPRSWRLFFSSHENFLLNEFKENIQELFDEKQFWSVKSKNIISIYLNNSEIAEFFLKFSPTYRTKQCDSFPKCPLLRNKKFGPCIRCNPIIFKRLRYPPATIPPIKENLQSEFLKYYFSVEGTITDRIQLSQRHPTLLQQIQNILTKLQISSSLKCYQVKNNRYEWYLRIVKKDLRKFRKNINFLPVKIQNSIITKSEKLNTLIQA